jgi:hypothetical protein
MTVEEQILYRCLTEIVLQDLEPPDRSPQAYADFVQAPIYYASSRAGGQGPFRMIFGSDITHVLKSDITAFYQYVDHAVLRNELLTLSADFDAVDALLMLLREVQGRDFGLPQLYYASDWLSEIYIDVLERVLLRRGLAVWRFNDDFRVACVGYEKVLSSIEQLDAAARDLGLVVNEFKTVSPRYGTYVSDVLGVTAEEQPHAQLPADDVEALVGDYTETELESEDEALRLVLSVREHPEEDELDAHDLSVDNLRRLRRALATLTRAADGRAVDNAVLLLVYAPSLTPRVVAYLAATGRVEPDRVAQAIDLAVSRVSFGSWQSLWWLYLIDELDFLRNDLGNFQARVNWTLGIRAQLTNTGTIAFANLALARAGMTTVEELDIRFQQVHPAWRPTYLAAFKALRDHDSTSISERAWNALRREPLPARWILDA